MLMDIVDEISQPSPGFLTYAFSLCPLPLGFSLEPLPIGQLPEPSKLIRGPWSLSLPKTVQQPFSLPAHLSGTDNELSLSFI